MPVAAATVREFKVLWYEVRRSAGVVVKGRAPLPMPRVPPKRVEVFHVRARTLDRARAAARDYVTKRLQHDRVLRSINFTQRPNEMIVYTAEKQQ